MRKIFDTLPKIEKIAKIRGEEKNKKKTLDFVLFLSNTLYLDNQELPIDNITTTIIIIKYRMINVL